MEEGVVKATVTRRGSDAHYGRRQVLWLRSSSHNQRSWHDRTNAQQVSI